MLSPRSLEDAYQRIMYSSPCLTLLFSTNTFRNFIYCMFDVSIYFRISLGFHSKSSDRIIHFLNPFNSLCTLILYLALLADATLCCTSLHSAVSLLFAVTMQSRATMTTRTSRATTGRAWSEVSQVSHRCHRFSLLCVALSFSRKFTSVYQAAAWTKFLGITPILAIFRTITQTFTFPRVLLPGPWSGTSSESNDRYKSALGLQTDACAF